MEKPLDYYAPRRPDEPDPHPAHHAPRAAIPVEFDAPLTQTADLAAARAVEAELRRHGVDFFRSEGAAARDRGIELHVRSADHARAVQLAAMIFARRKRLDQISPRRKPVDSIIPNNIGVGGGFPGPL